MANKVAISPTEVDGQRTIDSGKPVQPEITDTGKNTNGNSRSSESNKKEACMQQIVNMYPAQKDSQFLFSIIEDPQKDHRRQYQNALIRINRNLKKLGEDIGLELPLTMYVARHSWATTAHCEGVPISVISEGMGHDNEKTTQIYLASLEHSVVDKANRKILKLV